MTLPDEKEKPSVFFPLISVIIAHQNKIDWPDRKSMPLALISLIKIILYKLKEPKYSLIFHEKLSALESNPSAWSHGSDCMLQMCHKNTCEPPWTTTRGSTAVRGTVLVPWSTHSPLLHSPCWPPGGREPRVYVVGNKEEAFGGEKVGVNIPSMEANRIHVKVLGS